MKLLTPITKKIYVLWSSTKCCFIFSFISSPLEGPLQFILKKCEQMFDFHVNFLFDMGKVESSKSEALTFCNNGLYKNMKRTIEL